MHEECRHCAGTGRSYDSTCSGNIYTHAQAAGTCFTCKGTGRVAPRHFIEIVREFDDSEMPDYALWMC